MLNARTESLVQFCDLPDYLKTLTGRKAALSTFHRWRLKGRYGVKLETIKIGGNRYTSKEAVDRFFHLVTAAADGESVAAVPNPGNQEAADYLAAEGI